MTKKNSAKIFICHHPNGLFLYKNLIQIIRRHDKDIKIILFKVNHPYFLKFNFEPYKKYFDETIEFDFIHYEKNFLAGIRRALAFQKKLKRVETTLLTNFETIDLFLSYSTWLPMNTLLYRLSRNKKIKNITKFNLLRELEPSQLKINKIKTLFCALYSLPLECYKVKVVDCPHEKFTAFIYADKTPGISLEVVSPTKEVVEAFDSRKENILPYPIIKNKKSLRAEKDMVIIFGTECIFRNYSCYFPSYEEYAKRLAALFGAIENKYSGCKLYYKTHPIDRGKVMPGIDSFKYNLFDNTINAEEILDKYHERIKAIYSFVSTSNIVGSFLGLPSYTFYRYLCSPLKIERTDIMFNRDNVKSKLLFHISNLKEIGKIDKLEPNFLAPETLDNRCRKILNI